MVLKAMSMKKILALVLMLCCLLTFSGCGQNTPVTSETKTTQQEQQAMENVRSKQTSKIDEQRAYTSKAEVALYIHTFHKLPQNFITKREAERLGWKNKGSLDKVAPGKSIGGDNYGNYEGLLPKKTGRSWRECDIDYNGGNRNAKRIVYSTDGMIYYTQDHYKNFERLY